MRSAILTDFVASRPLHEVQQDETLAWLAEAHAEAEATIRGFDRIQRDEFALRLRNVLGRCAPGRERIASRGCCLDEIVHPRWDDGAIFDLRRRPNGAGTDARTKVFAGIALDYFSATYEEDAVPPDDIIHVTCTGYVSPSAAQRLVASRGWATRVTHAYHMGCYAALPAVRIAEGFLRAHADQRARVDIVHTELCSLHLDPTDHRLEQLVVQSLFADGLIRYSVVTSPAPGLRLLATHDAIVPDSDGSMSWVLGDHGMRMTLAREVPDRIGQYLPGFLDELYRRSDVDASVLRRSTFAIHPGGPKIIDGVCDILGLEEPQVAASRQVLRSFGNMSSATLPHVWKHIVEDNNVQTRSKVVSLAFGPGLTVCGAVFEKVECC